MSYSENLKKKILNYYRDYYKSCGLDNFEEKSKKRLFEEDLERKRIERLTEILSLNFKGQKHFIFGAGTGGLAVVLHQNFFCEVAGIEPQSKALDIIREKVKEKGINPDNFKKEFGENLSFQSGQFDFVHCFTVLEHVNNVEKSIKEMIRITKPGGHIYINTPNYKYPQERHYKIFFPTFLPKIFGILWLLLNRKPTKFLKTINFITEKRLNKVLNNNGNIYWLRIYKPLLKEKGLKGKVFNFFKFNLGVYPTQEIIIKKICKNN